ncbi:MAG: AAA family ATPase [Solirubrobacterales bacterium]|nr:MAG: AAA family ATPase [Solirubrobacterales bacterium]
MERLFGSDDEARPARASDSGRRAPLAVRMRPATLDEFIGQEHLLGPAAPLRSAIEQGRPHSMILYGPPGTGKTTLARIVASGARAAFEELSAVQVGRAEVRGVLERAAHRRDTSGEPTIFFLDEIHRFNKAQQDALLPAVEEGLVTLIGATTENPYFEVNGALLSRTVIYELEPLADGQIEALVRRAAERELAGVSVEPDAIAYLAERAAGDARAALAALELAAQTAGEGAVVDVERAEAALQRPAIGYDKDGDRHYDAISAWIKATRASDPDASMYYLAVMLEGGEDPRFIARRMIVLASEDIGNADPQALSVATAAAAAVDHVGVPECQFNLAQAAIYLSLAPKSDAVKRALGVVRGHIREHGASMPPAALRSGSYPGAGSLGRGVDYDSPHAHPGHVSPQEVMPPGLEGARFYEPDEAESELAARLEQIRRARGGS